jgi:hypothetical protein
MLKTINIQRLNKNDKKVFVIKHGSAAIQVDEAKAEYLVRTLGLFMGFSVVDQRENISMINQKANANSTKENPLGV